MYPLLANEGKELESTAVTSDVEHSEGKVFTQGNTTQNPFSLVIVSKLVHCIQIKTWIIVSHYSALSTSAFIDPVTRDNADEDVEPDS